MSYYQIRCTPKGTQSSSADKRGFYPFTDGMMPTFDAALTRLRFAVQPGYVTTVWKYDTPDDPSPTLVVIVEREEGINNAGCY